MALTHIHTFLVHAGKGSTTPPRIGGASVPLKGKLFDLLNGIYARSDDECDIDITFRPAASGRQQNPCRDLILQYLRDPTLPHGRMIAERLEKMTDNRSGLGLLFLISGKEGKETKLVISRFPTDSAILADENQTSLIVEFLERVFMKSKYSYKAVSYRGLSLSGDFWSGRAIDKQISGPGAGSSDYWIADFLESAFSVTPALGTRRLATAIRVAAKTADLDVKTELAAVSALAGGLRGRNISIADFEQHFGLSEKASKAIRDGLKNPAIEQERFRFDFDEFNSIVRYRSVELDSGAMLTAPSMDFDKVFQKEVVNKSKREIRFSTVGTVVSESLKKAP